MRGFSFRQAYYLIHSSNQNELLWGVLHRSAIHDEAKNEVDCSKKRKLVAALTAPRPWFWCLCVGLDPDGNNPLPIAGYRVPLGRTGPGKA